ncbi:hypothetical protein ACA910_009739 [Epithemia clementina (nom. ined.)]
MRTDCSSLSSTEDTRECASMDRRKVAPPPAPRQGRRENRRASWSPGANPVGTKRILFRNHSGDMSKDDLRRELAYQWYTRCGRPTRKSMKDRVTKIEGCDITTSDVDLLPWLKSGLMVDHGAMMKMMKQY